MSKTIRVDDQVYGLIMELKEPDESASEALARMLKEVEDGSSDAGDNASGHSADGQ